MMSSVGVPEPKAKVKLVAGKVSVVEGSSGRFFERKVMVPIVRAMRDRQLAESKAQNRRGRR